jgi:hypothetical protein
MSRGVHFGLALLVLTGVCAVTAGTGLAHRPPPDSPGAEVTIVMGRAPPLSRPEGRLLHWTGPSIGPSPCIGPDGGADLQVGPRLARQSSIVSAQRS